MSNVQPNPSAPAKTALAPKAGRVLLGVALLLLPAMLSWQRHPSTVKIGDNLYELERVSGASDLARGLSSRDSMPQNAGMLFDFGRSGRHGIWMKDMRFSLDIIWLDEGQVVTHIEQNVSPSTYPRSFSPPEPSVFVIELNAGQVATNGLKLGDRVNL